MLKGGALPLVLSTSTTRTRSLVCGGRVSAVRAGAVLLRAPRLSLWAASAAWCCQLPACGYVTPADALTCCPVAPSAMPKVPPGSARSWCGCYASGCLTQVLRCWLSHTGAALLAVPHTQLR